MVGKGQAGFGGRRLILQGEYRVVRCRLYWTLADDLGPCQESITRTSSDAVTVASVESQTGNSSSQVLPPTNGTNAPA